MKKPTVKYSKGEIGRVRIVEDFLPSPDRLVALTDAQVAEVRRRRADPNRKLVSHAAAQAHRSARVLAEPVARISEATSGITSMLAPDFATLIRATNYIIRNG